MGKIFNTLAFAKLWIGRPFGIDTYIHWTWFAFIAYGFFHFTSSLYGILLVLFYGCILGHELGHSLVAKYYNISVKNIYLLPIGGVAQVAIPPDNPKQEFWITIAGPLVNFVIAPFCYAVALFFEPESYCYVLFMLLAILNVVMAGFNLLLPMFPMDGGRIFRSAFSHFGGDYVAATRISVRMGQVLAVVFMLVGLYIQAYLWLAIGVLIIMAGQSEWERTQRYYLRSQILKMVKNASKEETAIILENMKNDKEFTETFGKELSNEVKSLVDEKIAEKENEDNSGL